MGGCWGAEPPRKSELLHIEYFQVTCLVTKGGRAYLNGGGGGAEPPHKILNLEHCICSGDVPIKREGVGGGAPPHKI